MTLLLGLFSWLLVGLATAVSARFFLPGEPPLAWLLALGGGLLGALAGGLLATALGFGGLAGYDTRSLLTAVLAAVASLLVLRIASLTADS
jgi:uncharacterized membrane protein YeaQ/YmgE (transglycosylase-associated protein family)